MSTENIVNRVPSQFNIEAEKAKLDKTVEEVAVELGQAAANTANSYRTPVNDPTVKLEETNKLLEQDPEALKSAWDELTNFGTSDTPESSGTGSDTLSQLRALVGGDDLKVFRQQVIKALKHIGVDTKRFFGE